MRISDWSSDVCSSDLRDERAGGIVGELKLFVPLEGLVDLAAERTRLDKELAKVTAEKGTSEAKLAKFRGNVRPAVVEHDRHPLADRRSKPEALHAQLARLAGPHAPARPRVTRARAGHPPKAPLT